MIMPRLCSLWRGTVPATHLPLTPGAMQQYCLWKCCPSNWTIAVREFSINFVFLQFAMQTVSKILPWISHFVYFHKWIYISYICALARIHFHIDSTDYTRITRSTWFAANPQLLRLIQSAKYAMKICQRKRIPEHIQKIRGASSPEIELDPQQLRWKLLYIFYIFFSFRLINTFPWWIQCGAGKVDAVKISTARIFYCSHFSINLITRRFVIIGAWKNKFNFFSLHQATLPKLAAP